MNVLVVDDDRISRLHLTYLLEEIGYTPLPVSDGLEALAVLESPDAPPIAILDWEMPGLSGPAICEHIRRRDHQASYLILLSARESLDDIVTGLAAGANDYLTKPYHREELIARLGVARRVVTLERGLQQRVAELEAALQQVQQLEGLLPICAWCGNIRNDNDYWQKLDTYLAQRTRLRFTHGICPNCMSKQLAQDHQAASPPPQPPAEAEQ